MKKIGICGGTFNPIHNAHLLIAETARGKYNLDKVLFIPSGNPPHKKEQDICDSFHRLEMIKCAVENNDSFEVDDIEIVRDGYTYSIDTILLLHEKYTNTEFYYIVGADVILDLINWKSISKVAKLTKFIAFFRPGHKEKEFNERIKLLKDMYGLNILTTEGIIFDISSSYLRKRIKENNSIKYLIPDLVEKYILENKLYK